MKPRCPRCGNKHLNWLHDENGTNGSDAAMVSLFACLGCHSVVAFDKKDMMGGER